MLEPGLVFSFNTYKNIWEKTDSEMASVFYYAMLDRPPHGFNIYEPIQPFYQTEDKRYIVYYGDRDKYYIKKESGKLIEIMRVSEGDSRDYLEKLENRITIDK